MARFCFHDLPQWSVYCNTCTGCCDTVTLFEFKMMNSGLINQCPSEKPRPTVKFPWKKYLQNKSSKLMSLPLNNILVYSAYCHC